MQDVRALEYPAATFDIVVASLLLMWFPELDLACSELRRVTRPGGRLVVAITHPFSYRIGEVRSSGAFEVKVRYQDPFKLQDLHIGGKVGPFSSYHRPISQYFNALLAAGWRVSALREWSIDIEDYERQVPLAGRNLPRTGLVPMYAFFLCENPGC